MKYPPIIPLFVLSALSASHLSAQEAVVLEKIQVEDHANVMEERQENSIAKKIISGEELTRYGDLNALEILKRTPGVTISDGKKKGEPGKGYTKVLIDGEEVSTSSKRRVSPLEQISPDMIERVEVMTNGSAEYTAEAMGGIVNIVLKKPKSQGASSAKLTFGLYDDVPMSTLFAQHEGKTGAVSYLVNATISDNRKSDTSSIRIDEPLTYSDQFQNDEFRDQSLNLTTKLIYTPSSKDKYTFDGLMMLNNSQNKTQKTGYTDGSSSVNTLIHNTDKSNGMILRTKIGGQHHLSGTELIEWKLKFHQGDDDGESESVQTLPTSKITTQDDESTFRVFGADGSYSVAAGDHFIKVGTNLRRFTQDDSVRRTLNGTDTTDPLDSDSIREDRGALYAQDEIGFGENVVVTPGLRYESVHRDYRGSSNIEYLAPSLHLLYKLTPQDNLRASVAKTVKLPRFDELSSSTDSSLDQNDLHHPDKTGNPNLREEKALSYEVRAEHYFEDKGIVSIGGFYRDIQDKIEKYTFFDTLSSRYIQRPENVGNGKLWGMELELKKSLDVLVSGLGVFANATIQDSSLRNSATGMKRPIKQTSDYLYNIGIDHTLQSYRLTYGAAYRYVGGYDDPIDENGFSESQQGYGTLDLYAKKRLDSTFKLGLNLKNITSATITTTSKQYDTSGVLTQTQIDKEKSQPQILLTLEGKW
ncbi:MAG: TonB-dependent receptor [Sulfuricurvum sp.]|nr:TonB-dependent receptor [Sulfuricurvum sp.]